MSRAGQSPPQVSVSGLRVRAVAAGSALAELGLRPGDVIRAIDGLVPRDVIDVQLELPGARQIVVEGADGRRRVHRMPTPMPAAAGVEFEEPVPGGIRECNNHCEFCFIRGLPPGLRETLYVFDDDYRYAFLWGNFLTLTNLSEPDWARRGSWASPTWIPGCCTER